jgi:hypothetical protein
VFLLRLENVFSFVMRKLERFLNEGLLRLDFSSPPIRQEAKGQGGSRHGSGSRRLLLFFVMAVRAADRISKIPPTLRLLERRLSVFIGLWRFLIAFRLLEFSSFMRACKYGRLEFHRFGYRSLASAPVVNLAAHKNGPW